ncbi:hypothetical protein DSUL_260006 [Desulfovibrionales bacterium]
MKLIISGNPNRTHGHKKNQSPGVLDDIRSNLKDNELISPASNIAIIPIFLKSAIKSSG